MIQKIKEEHKSARMNQDKFRLKVLGTLLAEIQSVGKNNGNRDTTEDEALTVLLKFAKNLGDTYKMYTGQDITEPMKVPDIDSTELLEEYIRKTTEMHKENDIYSEFLPKKLSRVDIVYNIGLFLGQNPNAQMKDIMQYFSKNYKGRYSGKELSAIVKELL